MAYVLVKNGIVIQKQPTVSDGFIVAPETVVCGMSYDGTSFSMPVPVISSAQVELERDRRIALPLTATVSSGSFSIDMDPASQRNLSDLAISGLTMQTAGTGQVVAFRDHNNAMHDLSAEDLIALGTQVRTRISKVYANSWALKAMSPIPLDYATNESYWDQP